LIRAHQELPVLCRHLHLPVQSGSDAVLKRMIRRYTAAEYIERIGALKEAVPGLTLSSDIIVGFPGETEPDFERTLELARAAEFVAVFGFTYSQRPFTPALKLVDDVSEEEKGRRLARLFAVVDESKARHLAAQVGQPQLVLVEGTSKQGNLTGRTERNEIVHLLGADEIVAPPGSLLRVTVEEAFKNSLAGRVLEIVRAAPVELSMARSQAVDRSRAGAPSGESVPAPRRALPVLGGA
jgi:tRNA-2-methylthio-N6-dimethylallyladenosine synthase